MNTDLALRLADVAPSVAFTLTRTPDPDFVWDGDGPDPDNDGYFAHDVDVHARAIVDGHILTGRASLGGCYYAEDEPIGDVSGYLPQMLDEAITELSAALTKLGTPAALAIIPQLDAARAVAESTAYGR